MSFADHCTLHIRLAREAATCLTDVAGDPDAVEKISRHIFVNLENVRVHAVKTPEIAACVAELHKSLPDRKIRRWGASAEKRLDHAILSLERSLRAAGPNSAALRALQHAA